MPADTRISATGPDLLMVFDSESASRQTGVRTPEGLVYSIKEEGPHYSDDADPEMMVPESTDDIPESVIQFA